MALEEVLFDLRAKSGRIPLRLPGLAHVAFSRVKSFAGFACRGAPPLRKFLQYRENDHRRNRVFHEKEMGELREQFMISQGPPPEEELRMHLIHLSHRKMADLGRGPTSVEKEERRDWLLRRGALAPPPTSSPAARTRRRHPIGGSRLYSATSRAAGAFPSGRNCLISCRYLIKELPPRPQGGPLLSIRGLSNASLISPPHRLGSLPSLAYVGLERELRLDPAKNLPGQSRISGLRPPPLARRGFDP